MSSLFFRSRKAPHVSCFDVHPDVSFLAEARRAAMAFALGEAGGGAPPRKPHRATLPDVDLSLAVRAPRRPLLERLFGSPRAWKKHHKPSSRIA